MNNSGDAAEQVLRMSLEGAEFALKITGTAAKNIAAMLYTVLTDQKKTKGKARVETMLRDKRPMTIYTVKKRIARSLPVKPSVTGLNTLPFPSKRRIPTPSTSRCSRTTLPAPTALWRNSS